MRASTGLSLLFFAAEAAHAFVGHIPLHASSSTWQSASSFTSSPSSSLEARSRLRSTAKAGWAPGARTARIVVTRMGDVVWSKTKIVESSKVAPDQHALTIDAGDISKGYEIPGQYVQIRVGEGKPGFFAIASPPSSGDGEGASYLEFLIKATDSTTPLITAKPGDTVEMSPVMGKGFPIKENFSGYKYDFPVQNVVLMASGTGIAPIRAAIESGALELPDEEDDGVFGRSCKLYWGCKDEENMPWQDKMKDWDSRGVEVVPVLSEPSSSWTGRTGFVQGALKEDGIRLPRNSALLVCGHPAMGEEAKAIALAAGVLDGRVLSNY